MVADAIEIGARILDREQAGASVEVLQRATWRRPRARSSSASGRPPSRSSPSCARGWRRPSGPTRGTSPRCWTATSARSPPPPCSTRCARRSRELLNESRERLFKQFSSAEESNPLAAFQRHAVAAIRQSSDQQHAHLREMNQRIGALQLEIDEAAGREGEGARRSPPSTTARPPRAARTRRRCSRRSTRSPAVRATTATPSATCTGVGGRKGDVLVAIDGCSRRPARADRVRGQELARWPRRSRSRSSTRRWPSATPPTRVWVVPDEEQAARPAPSRCARSTATSCSSSTTPRRAAGSRCRSPTRWPGPAC